MKKNIPSKKSIKELSDFLTLLYRNEIEISKTEPKGDLISGGLYTYHPSVIKFFEIASQEHWKDYKYIDNFSEEMIEPGKIEEASIDQLKTILTWCDRGERFVEGQWEDVIKNEIIKRVLLRLKEIK